MITKRMVALIDVDGVVVENPLETVGKGTINDTNFWANHWNNPEGGRLQVEVISLVQALVACGWHVIFLTARPENFRGVTVKLLRRAGFDIRSPNDYTPVEESGWAYPALVMIPGTEVRSSASWKQQTVRALKEAGLNVQFMIEDYRPNAEAIRSQVPVFLYERQKLSQYLEPICHRCGSLSVCWCPSEV
jgi:hypothetical protein